MVAFFAFVVVYDNQEGKEMKRKRKHLRNINSGASIIPLISHDNRPVTITWDYIMPTYEMHMYIHDFQYMDDFMRVADYRVFQQGLELIEKFSSLNSSIYPDKGYIIPRYLYERDPAFWSSLGFVLIESGPSTLVNRYYILSKKE